MTWAVIIVISILMAGVAFEIGLVIGAGIEEEDDHK